MNVTSSAVRESIREHVIDPELGINIVDLGLIYGIDIEKDEIVIRMTLTTPGCPLVSVFEMMVRDAVRQTPGFDQTKQVRIELTFDPPWDRSKMSEKAKAELGVIDL